jgi:DNA-binding XRE family transcriptional regulator
MGARASGMNKKTEEPALAEVTLAVLRHPCQSFGDRLRRYRRERAWRQVDLANAIGVNKDTVRNWETGRSEPRLWVLGQRAVTVIRQILAEPATLPIHPGAHRPAGELVPPGNVPQDAGSDGHGLLIACCLTSGHLSMRVLPMYALVSPRSESLRRG